jgi:hypothetical protein
LILSGFRAFFEFDNKIWKSLRDLTINPGSVALAYINGQRVTYVNPIKYLLVTMAIGYGVSLLTGEIDLAIEATSPSYTPATGQESGELAKYRHYIEVSSNVIKRYAELISLMAVPLIAFFIRAQNFRQSKNYAEVLVYVSYVWGHANVIFIPITLTFTISGIYWHWLKPLLLVGMLYWSSRVFYDRGWIRNLISTSFYGVYFLMIYTALTQLFIFAGMKGWV